MKINAPCHGDLECLTVSTILPRYLWYRFLYVSKEFRARIGLRDRLRCSGDKVRR
jgi:hypothetical protein